MDHVLVKEGRRMTKCFNESRQKAQYFSMNKKKNEKKCKNI